jgi:signal-transduction protein with cAMP-binding, CBS, and nucleotidyltransferase domain
MNKKIITLDFNKSVKDAAEMMNKTRQYEVIVTKNNKPIGIITDSDIIKKAVAKNLKPSSVKIKKFMKSPLVTAHKNETILDVSRKMKRNNIKRLPVVEDGKPVGMITLSDIARTCPEMIDLLEWKLQSREAEIEPKITEKSTSGICDSCGIYSDDLRNANDQWVCEACREELEE